MKPRGQPAFTLIELLAVIGVIAILAGLLLPALSNAKAKAQRVACLNKLRQWGLAALSYKDEHEDFLPREKCVTGIHTWADVSAANNNDVWFNALPPECFGQKGVAGYAADPDGFHSPKNIFHCPVAKLPSGNVDPVFSLAFNSKLSRTTDVLERAKFSCIQEPVTTVLFLDCGLTNEQPLYSTQKPYYGQPSAWANRLSGRHNRGANLALADGHAQWFPGNKLVDPSTGNGFPSPAEVLWTY